MKKLVTTLGLVAALALVAQSALAANAVRISQTYGGGGVSTGSPTYNVDYVELFNSSGVAVNIGGWVIEYGSATGTWGSSTANTYTFPANTLIQPCSYLLVQWGAVGTVGAALPVTPDYVMGSTFSMSGSNGKVGLFNAMNLNLACGSELAGTLVDKVAYGTSNCAEGTAMGALTSTTAGFRNGGGTTDTDNNLADWASGAPAPRNSATPANANCIATPSMNSTWGHVKQIYR